MRVKHGFLLLLAAILIAPSLSVSQFGGGREGRGKGGGFGGGMPAFDPTQIFTQLAKGKDVLVRSELDEFGQRLFDRWAGQLNITDGRITRDQFKQITDNYAQRRFPSSQDGNTSGGPPAFGGGGPIQMGGGMQFGGGQGNFGGGDGMQMRMGGRGGSPDQMAERFFQMADRNKDGMLGYEEMNEALRNGREKFDTNNDGFIDLNEYKPFFTQQYSELIQRSQGNQQSVNPNSPNPMMPMDFNPMMLQQGPTINIGMPQAPQEEEQRPNLLRVGKLPSNLPSWFTQLDTDQDGQVGFYEWRKDSRTLEDFQELDWNADGLLTPEEVLKDMKGKDDARRSANSNSPYTRDPNIDPTAMTAQGFGASGNGFNAFGGGRGQRDFGGGQGGPAFGGGQGGPGGRGQNAFGGFGGGGGRGQGGPGGRGQGGFGGFGGNNQQAMMGNGFGAFGGGGRGQGGGPAFGGFGGGGGGRGQGGFGGGQMPFGGTGNTASFNPGAFGGGNNPAALNLGGGGGRGQGGGPAFGGFGGGGGGRGGGGFGGGGGPGGGRGGRGGGGFGGGGPGGFGGFGGGNQGGGPPNMNTQWQGFRN